MKRHLLSASLLLSACIFPGCETSESGRMRMGIQDPIVRHKQRAWKWPFQRGEKPRPAPSLPPAEDGALPEYQTFEGLEPG